MPIIKSILSVLFAFALVVSSAYAQQAGQIDSRFHIGVYNDVGAGRSLADLMRSIRDLDGAYIRELTAEEIRDGECIGLDVLIHPGGSGSKQGNQLGERGRQRIREFVNGGGGFIGICAGAYLASADYSWSLNLLDAKVLDRKHWARGTGTVEIEMSDSGQGILQTRQRKLQIYYGQGPLLAPAHNPQIPDYKTLAIYKTEIAKNGAPTGVMIGTSAVAHGEFGSGQVICFSCHPEKTENLWPLVHRAIDTVKKPDRSDQVNLPDRMTTAAQQTPDVSQADLPNSNYCAPCAVANILYQFSARQLIDLPSPVELSEPARQSITTGQKLAIELGDAQHMNTLGRKGTNRYRLVNGFDRYVRENTDQMLLIDYLGVRPYDRKQVDADVRSRIDATMGVPRLSDLQHRLSSGDGVIILFGSYKPNPDRSGRLERVGGHYVSAVGYGEFEGRECATCILLHDSNDGQQGTKYVFARKVTGPTELWSEGELLASSSRLLQLEGAPIRKDGRVAYLETVFAFRTK